MNTKTYKIYKGCHYSNFFPKFLLPYESGIMGNFIVFDDSCKYEIDEASCVNKLFGFCFGFGVHKNSIRFGWTYNKETNNIYIWIYTYINGHLTKEKVFSCDVGESHFYRIEYVRLNKTHGTYLVSMKIDDEYVLKELPVVSDSFFLTTLGPYFGGNTRAPHKIKIECYGNSDI